MGDLVAEAQGVEQAAAAHVEVAVLEAEVVGGRRVVQVVGHGRGLVEDLQFVHGDLDGTGGAFGVHHVLRPGLNGAADLQDPLLANGLRGLGDLRRGGGVDDQLGDALAVA